MAPKPPSKGSKAGAKSNKAGSKPGSKPKTPYKPKKRDEVKAKRPATTTDQKKRKKVRTYTDKELNIPKLNMITPAGVQKPKGKKKGKVFVDDQESMMTILAMVNADKEGQIESKMVRQRQMEEIREARQREMEKRKAVKDGKLVSSSLFRWSLLLPQDTTLSILRGIVYSHAYHDFLIGRDQGLST